MTDPFTTMVATYAVAMNLLWIPIGIIHLFFAIAVYADANMMQSRLKRGTFLVGGGLWALATLVGGLLPVGLYWLIHHSTLRPSALAGSPNGGTRPYEAPSA